MYELLDAGDGRRLERFGERIVDRPAPAAAGWPRRDPAAWRAADARYERPGEGAGGWVTRPDGHGPWTVSIEGVTLELRLADAGQVGVFAEHLALAGWLRAQVAAARVAAGVAAPGPSVLHLFAYTGALTLVAAGAGAAVAHVDASRPAVAWARRNAELSGLADRSIRWLVDDAGAFVRREIRRGRHYAGVVLDPPTYGHGPGGSTWRLDTGLPPLLADAAALLDGQPGAFLLLTAHTPGLGPERLAASVRDVAPAGHVEADDLTLVARSGTRLPLGAYARWTRS